MSNFLRPRGLQHASFPCPSLSPEVCSNSCALSQWCYLTVLSFATHFSFCLHYFRASASFPKGGLFSSSGRSIGASALASVPPINIQDWFPLGLILTIPLTDLISLLIQGTLKSLLQHHSLKASIFWHSALSVVQLSWDTDFKTLFPSCIGTTYKKDTIDNLK